MNKITKVKAHLTIEGDKVGVLTLDLEGPGTKDRGLEHLGDWLKLKADAAVAEILKLKSGALDASQKQVTELKAELAAVKARIEAAADAAKVSRGPGRPRSTVVSGAPSSDA
jgi:hypothetical protein